MRYNIVTALSYADTVASVNEARCDRCKRCGQVCPFTAIGEDASRISIDTDKCYGCGICRQSCPKEAIELVKRVGLQRTKTGYA